MWSIEETLYQSMSRNTDRGIEALAIGCPNLVKLKVKKCRVVTGEIGDWLREQRRTLVVSMDSDETVAVVEGEVETGGGEEPMVAEGSGGAVAEIGNVGGGGGNNGGSSSRLATIRSKLGFLGGRNLVTCTFRRWFPNDNA